MRGSGGFTGTCAAATGRRAVVVGGLSTLALPTALRAATRPVIRVSPSGRDGAVATLGEALALAARPGAPSLILLDPGVYDEKLTVTVPGVTIAGAADGAIVSYAAAAALPRPDGGGNWGTSGSATLTIAAPDVTLARLTIRNAHDYLVLKTQAVALAVGRDGDRCRILDCSVEGWQDTLLIQARTFMDRCRVSGCVDFVFGGGAAWIGRSTIVSRHVPGGVGAREGGGGFIAAPSTPADQPWGLVFADCRLAREQGLPDGATWLGRPWRAGGNMALTGFAAFVRCWMDAHVAPTGWTSMGYRGPDGTPRQLTPAEARLFEAANRGPGARRGDGRRQLDPIAYAQMTPVTVLGGWQPETTYKGSRP